MGLKNELDQVWAQRLEVVFRPPALYNIGATTLFTIAGGPVIICALFAHTIAAVTVASTFTIAVAGTTVDSGAALVTSAINTLIVSPLDDLAIQPIVPNVAVSGAMAGGFMLLSVTGNIVLTVAGANTDGIMAWYCAYYRMSQAGSIR